MSWPLVGLFALTLAACNLVGGIDAAQPACAKDGKKNGRETDVDCGGGCGKCEDGMRCAKNEDCTSDICADKSCQPPDCDDGHKNGTETDVDCGGPNRYCDRCYGGRACEEDEDCASFPEAGDMGVHACQDGICRSTCCGDDCELCGCTDPDNPTEACCKSSCDPGRLGTACDPEGATTCEYPLACMEVSPTSGTCL